MKRLYFAIANKFFKPELTAQDNFLFYRGIKKSLLVQGFSFFFVFVTSLLLVKTAGVTNYGIYVNIFNWVNVLAMISCFGMEDVVLAKIPVYVRQNKKTAIFNLVLTANKIIFFVSLFSSLVFILIVFSGFVPAFDQYKYLMLLAMINVYLSAFIIVNQQTLQAFNRFFASQAIDKILKPVLLILLLSSFWLADVNINARVLIIFNAVVLAICAVVVLFFLKNTLEKLPGEKNLAAEKTKLFGQNGYFLLISLLVLLKSKISMLILGSYNETDSVGILNITYRLSDFVLLPYLLIHAVVPQLFSSHAQSDVGYRKRLFHKSNLFIAVATLPIILFFVILGKPVLRFYDENLGQYFPILLILCGSQFLYALFGPSSALLMMQGKQRQAAFAMLFDIVFNCILFFLLIDWLGLVGVALASFFGSLFYNIFLRILVNKHLSEK